MDLDGFSAFHPSVSPSVVGVRAPIDAVAKETSLDDR
jgi:hypothetical protein